MVMRDGDLYSMRKQCFCVCCKPELEKNIFRTDSIHLTDQSCYIHEPFDFDSSSNVIKTKQSIDLNRWHFLLTSCNSIDIVPYRSKII